MKEEIQMRNLKRALSLALASVMLLGMMVIGASAVSISDFTDQDEIVNKEAVALLVDLGVINGKSDTNFGATDTLERAALAKMVFYTMMGITDASVYEGLETGFTDVSGCWAEGFINYCYSVGVLSGVGGSRFAPYSTLTVAQTAKALLVALGYDPKADISKYEGDAWAVNVMRDAQANGLLNGVSQGAHEAITRDNAARMIYNALFANMVTPNYQYDMGNRYVTSYQSTGSTLGQSTFGLVKITATVTGITNGMATLDVTAVNDNASITLSGSGVSVSNKLPATPDMLNTSVNLYARGTLRTNGTSTVATISSIYSTALVEASDNTVYTLAGPFGTAASGNATLKAMLINATTKVASLEVGAENVNTLAELAVFYNGVETSTTTTPTRANAIAKIGTAGIVVELKDTNSVEGVDTVVITEKTVATLAADPVVSTNAAGNTVVTISSLGMNQRLASTVVGYEDLVKGDVVLYVTIGGVTYIEKAASVSGVVNGTRNNTIRVNGVYYGASALQGATGNVAGWSDFRNTYTFYLDNGNHIVKAVAETSTTVSNYGVVLETAWVTGGGIGATSYGEALILKADGTTEIVTVSQVDGVKAAATGPTPNKIANLTEGEFVTYTVDANNNYRLTNVTEVTTVTGITNGQAALIGGNVVANANTVFLVKTGTAQNPVYTAYVGIAAVPSMSGATTKTVIVNGIAAYVYVSNPGTLLGSVGEYVYVPASSQYTGVPAANGSGIAYYEIDAIVNGVASTIKVDTTSVIAARDTMYTVSAKDANGVISAVAPTAPTTGITISGGTLISGNVVKTVDASTAFYYINTDGVVTALTSDSVVNDETDSVIVVDASNDGLADVVYIMQKVSDKMGPLNVKASVGGAPASDVVNGAWSGGGDGNTQATAKTESKTVNGAAGASLSLTATGPAGSTVTLVSGTLPTVMPEADDTVVLTWLVTAENGRAIRYFTLTLTLDVT